VQFLLRDQKRLLGQVLGIGRSPGEPVGIPVNGRMMRQYEPLQRQPGRTAGRGGRLLAGACLVCGARYLRHQPYSFLEEPWGEPIIPEIRQEF
jgi:hypothetical protein